MLRKRNTAYALTEKTWMPGLSEIVTKRDPFTAGFICIRWIGDRKAIEHVTEVWNRMIVDRDDFMGRGLLKYPAFRKPVRSLEYR
jgi:hypothetical protein